MSGTFRRDYDRFDVADKAARFADRKGGQRARRRAFDDAFGDLGEDLADRPHVATQDRERTRQMGW